MRNLSLDYLKLVLACCVVLLHTGFLSELSITANFLLTHGLFRLAVPTFLLITGYYFFKIDHIQQLKKWGIRLGLLYIIWAIFYAPDWFNLQKPLMTLIFFINGYFVLWYLIGALLGGFLLYALRHCSSIRLCLIACFVYLIGWSLQQLGNSGYFTGQLGQVLSWDMLHRNFLFMCFPFLTLGYLIHKEKLDQSFHPNGGLVIASLALLMIEAFLNYIFISDKAGYDQLISLFIACPIVFIYAKNLNIEGTTKQLANFATAIFLIHPFAITIIQHVVMLKGTLLSLMTLCVSAILAIGLIYLNNKSKVAIL